MISGSDDSQPKNPQSIAEESSSDDEVKQKSLDDNVPPSSPDHDRHYEEDTGTQVSHRATESTEVSPKLSRPPAATLSSKAFAERIIQEMTPFLQLNQQPGETPEQFQQRREDMRAYKVRVVIENLDQSLVKCINRSEQFSKLKPALQCNLLMTLIYAKMLLNDPKGVQTVIDYVYRDYKDYIDDFFEVLAQYQDFSINPARLKNQEDMESFISLTEQTQFLPAVWLLTQVAVRPGNHLVSPGRVIDMLSHLDTTKNLNNFVLTAFGQRADDVDIPFELTHEDNQTQFHQAIWVFSSVFTERKKEFWPGSDKSFSPQLQKALLKSLQNAVESQKRPELGEAFSQLTRRVPLARTRDGKKVMEMMTAAVADDLGIDKVEKAFKNRHLSRYQRDISGLVLAWHIKRQGS
ncbi:hypothetical protein [Endozoicomonas arenosclerae]|uniref:hypothetical protein n=1 Tax=Endozoicomonas arenosclerae TaxID=1633495 RepID=UPI0012947EC2|nr:hypothetical protein [Endozoicomonas arenosclerae]